jgi:hypothetical protein
MGRKLAFFWWSYCELRELADELFDDPHYQLSDLNTLIEKV